MKPATITLYITFKSHYFGLPTVIAGIKPNNVKCQQADWAAALVIINGSCRSWQLKLLNNPSIIQHFTIAISSIASTTPPTPFAMPALASSAGTIVRTCARQRLPSLRAPVALVQRRCESTSHPHWETTKIPNFDNYRSKNGEDENKTFQYLMAGSLGALSAMGAKATVVGEFNSPIRHISDNGYCMCG
jgi:hypothetical protein